MFPVLELGGASVTLYGLFVTAGYTAGAIWLLTQLKHMRGSPGEFWALGYALFFGAMLGGRLGYYLVEWEAVWRDPMAMLRDWRTGWVFWPGLLMSMAMGKVFQLGYNRLYRPRAYLPVADYFGPALALGHALGRVGCFLEGCCHGAPTILPWGLRFTHPASSVDERLIGVPLHPVQLIEAAGSFALFLFFGYFILPRIRAGKMRHGASFLGYLCAYALLRFALEFLRGDDRGSFLWPLLSPAQWMSLGVLAAAGAMLYRQGVFARDPRDNSIYL